ncbi:ankyrin repeat and protein kinase domain-containing protein 1 isoform X3 [Triticum aestivum]|uniref:ankyrin repeat and protein kinase domain-containing protein 1 isoform X3 n=1 Tax=Triticum aestivum TaxID=4565 RepID=UPI001D0095CD|nr:ankyrin repeat and protein kinase domain-containing protein 1-like isoform X3 [Triticum aestivum]XP_044365218.1 ankyrin repeat and protein kinase domain-containing protein 1-like isoform X3 [Triticum aestivum]
MLVAPVVKLHVETSGAVLSNCPPPLGCAALCGEFVAARYLLNHGADPNKIDGTGFAPLHCAAKNGHECVLRLLLSRGASVDIDGAHGTPLHTASYYGNAGALKILLDHHADPNRVSEISCAPLLMALSSTKHGVSESDSLNCVKLLVKAGADMNSANPCTPLVVAATYGLADCIKYLLEAGANPNIPDEQCGTTPIEIVADSGRRELVEILFPYTKPIQCVPIWSIDGIITHVKAKHLKDKDKVGQDKKAELKSLGAKAVEEKDYAGASKFYSEAIKVDPEDATLYSNRSFCHLRIGEARDALVDANACIRLQPDWPKGYWRKGAALTALKDHKEACDTYMAAMKLDPTSQEIHEAFWDAVAAMRAELDAGESGSSSESD